MSSSESVRITVEQSFGNANEKCRTRCSHELLARRTNTFRQFEEEISVALRCAARCSGSRLPSSSSGAISGSIGRSLLTRTRLNARLCGGTRCAHTSCSLNLNSRIVQNNVQYSSVQLQCICMRQAAKDCGSRGQGIEGSPGRSAHEKRAGEHELQRARTLAARVHSQHVEAVAIEPQSEHELRSQNPFCSASHLQSHAEHLQGYDLAL